MAERAWKTFPRTPSLRGVGAICLQTPSEFFAVSIELTLMLLTVFTNEVVIRDCIFVSCVQRLEFRSPFLKVEVFSITLELLL